MNHSPVSSLMVVLFLGSAYAQQTAPLPPIPGPGTLPAPATAPPQSAPAATAPPPAATVATPAGPVTYTVQAGDNLWTIAKKHGVKLEDLLKENEIRDPKNLKIGDSIQLPSGASAKAEGASPQPTTAAAAVTTAAPPAGADWQYYTIRKGDNPWKIAKALKVEHGKIVSLNEGVDFTRLRIGQQIKVPKTP